ncbi:MAG: hypothetical protein QOE60_2729 [Thermoleophilaceae bacterium]|jgi:hypothetical protein|nr:hypothetical protein [Thermoleophilaceae bacterium]
MRKLLIPVVAAVVAIAVAGIAYAANVYTVDGDTKPHGKGSAAKPLPVSLDFDYTVADTAQANRGIPVEKYFIGAEGLVTYPEAFPTCSGGASGANAPDPADAAKACKKARVGGGIIKALVGARNTPTTSSNCVLNLNLYNLKPGNYGDFGKVGKNGGLAIRIDGDPPAPPTIDDQYKGQCLAPQHASILAVYKTVKIKGVTSDELQFTVPPELLHPAQGLDVTVRQVASSIKKITASKKIGGKKRKVGFYSAIGCKGGKRSIQVTFVSETGQKSPVTKDKAC